MRSGKWITLFLLAGGFSASCSKGGGTDAKNSGDPAGTSAYDAEGNKHPCPPPETDCEERKEADLAFKDRCRLGGYRIQICGCQDLCTGNITGAQSGYDRSNKKKACEPPKDTCEESVGGAAFQDACSEAGHKLLECGCEWLCSGQLKEALPDPVPEEAPKDDEPKEGDGDAKKEDDKKGKKKK